MYLIVGLGNPEEKYSETRHNMGFDTINCIAKKIGIEINQKKFNSICGIGNIDEQKIILVKPQTYMNLSGKAIVQFRDFYKIYNKNIIVIYDDIDLEVGTIRIRKHGSSGSHNGMKSVVEKLKTEEFPRIRIGIGKPEDKYKLKNYVTEKMPEKDKEELAKSIEKAAEGAISIIKNGIDKVMNELNGRKI